VPAPPETASQPRLDARKVAPHAALVVALLWWAGPLTRAWGGTDPYALTLGIVSLIPLLLVARVRTLKARYLCLGLAPGCVLLLLGPWSMTGWSGLLEAATWMYAGLLGLGVLSYATTPSRRLLVLLIVGCAALDQFGQAWLAWWGGGSTSELMTGSFGWHNPFGVFLAAPLVVAYALFVKTEGVVRLSAALMAPFLGAGVLLSGSRATTGLVLLAVVAMSVFVIRGRREGLRLAAVVLSAPITAWVLSGPWLMSAGGAVATTSLGRGESGSSNLAARWFYDIAGLKLASQSWLTGTGVGSYGSAGGQYMPAEVAATDSVHNGWLQAAVDGGLLFAIPVVMVTAIPAFRACQRMVRGRRVGANAWQVGTSAAVLVLLGHALFDLDWRYPSLLAMFAILAALLPWRAHRSQAAPRSQTVSVVAVFLVVALGVGVSMVGTVVRFPDGGLPAWAKPVDDLTDFGDMGRRLPTAEGDRAVLLQSASSLDPDSFQDLMARTSRLAHIDPELAQVRALALGTRGDIPGMLWLSERSLGPQPRPLVILRRGDVLWLAGRRVEARAWVLGEYQRLVGLQGSVSLADLEKWLETHSVSRPTQDRASHQARSEAEGTTQ